MLHNVKVLLIHQSSWIKMCFSVKKTVLEKELHVSDGEILYFSNIDSFDFSKLSDVL